VVLPLISAEIDLDNVQAVGSGDQQLQPACDADADLAHLQQVNR